MEDWKIARINELARKAKSGVPLTEAELSERAALRREYLDAVTGNLQRQLDRVYLIDEQGKKQKLRRKGEGHGKE